MDLLTFSFPFPFPPPNPKQSLTLADMRYLSFTGHLLYYVSTTAELLTHFYLMFYSQRRGFLLSLGNLKVSPKIRRGSIKSIRIKTERRIKNIRSTGTVARIEVKTRIRRKRKIKVGITILVLNT